MLKHLLYMVAGLVLVWAIGCGEDTGTPTGEDGGATFSVEAVFPTDGAEDVPVNSALLLKFQKEVTRPSAEASIRVAPSVVGSAIYDESMNMLLFTPQTELNSGVTYTVTVEGAVDVEGNSVTPYSYSFTAGGKDTDAPQLLETVPANEDENVVRAEPITFRFDEIINPLTFTDSLQIDPKPQSRQEEWTFEWSSDGKVVQVSFGQLGRMQTYHIVLDSQNVADLSGNVLSTDGELRFTTHVGDGMENIDPNGSYSKVARYTIYRQSGGNWTVTWLPTRTNTNDRGTGTIIATNGTFSDVQMQKQQPWEKNSYQLSPDESQLDFNADFYWGNSSVQFKTNSLSLVFKNFTYNEVDVKPNEIWIGKDGDHPSSATKFTLINSDLPTDQ